MFAEEQFLRKKFGALYTDWAAKTPAFIPSFAKFSNGSRTVGHGQIITPQLVITFIDLYVQLFAKFFASICCKQRIVCNSNT
jgi:hypothetical protein